MDAGNRVHMIFVWLTLAVLLTLLGATVAVLAQEGEREHDEELAYEERVETQRAEIAVAACAADPSCRGEHEKSKARLKEHRLSHKHA